MNRKIVEYLKMNEVEYKERFSLAKLSSVRIGGEAEILAFPDNLRKLVSLVTFLEKTKIKHKITGRMTNILFSDDKYNGVIIRTDRISDYKIYNNVLSVSCGVSIPFISAVLCREGLSGFEKISGIPGSVAGAIIGNAGAFGMDISSCLTTVTFFDYDTGEVITLDRKNLEFSYRTSAFKKMKTAVLSASFLLTPSDCLSVKAEMDKYKKIRKDTQPVGIPSLGSSFKRPGESIYAAKLIDECGLKGHIIGGAQISDKHAGFIVNRGNATANDYINLSEYVKKCVYDRFGILLENEVEFVK